MDHLATEEALEQIKQDPEAETKSSTIVFKDSWNQGIIGIVASRLIETYYRPTIVFTTTANADKNTLVGSARSVKNFNIYDAITACSELLEHYGGHKYAAGLTIKAENLETFIRKFEQVVKESLQGEEPIQEIEIDDELLFEEITPELVSAVKEFAPFGPLNPNPIFMSTHIKDDGGSRRLKNNHLKLSLFQTKSRSYPINGIAFQQGDAYEIIKEGHSFDICYHLEENTFNGVTSIQLNVQDIKTNF